MKTYRILSIDAWADCCGCECEESKPNCWTWNNWHQIGECKEIPETIERALELMGEDIKHADKFYLGDDQYNMVITTKELNRPCYAFEYGSEYL